MTERNPGPDILNLAFADELYRSYLADPSSVEPAWRELFETMGVEPAASPVVPARTAAAPLEPAGPVPVHPASPAYVAAILPPCAENHDAELASRQAAVDQLVRSYRSRGHTAARIDPLDMPRPHHPELEPSYYGLTDASLGCGFSTDLFGGTQVRPLAEILACLRDTYCRTIGAQFTHIDDLGVRRWLQHRMESSRNRSPLSRAEQLRILTRLTDAVIFEEFIQTKFPGAKSFSLEGGESLIPLLDLAIEKAGEQGIDQIVLGMAHRGRLNVLANVVGKSPQEIFREFEDADPRQHQYRGDVKYHLGYNGDWQTAAGRSVHLSLCFNPSHLEFVNPVALGRMRAKQDRAGDVLRVHGMVVQIHGDAAFAGEGIIQETLNLSELESYTVGGAVHVIVNNQIGFTTDPRQSCSSTYTTDVAKMLQIPIFHVNGEDPEAVAQVVRLALDFRLAFRRDVVIDMWCYRRRGHNESDEPAFTQPLLYRAIEKRKPVHAGYLDHLLSLGEVTREEAARIVAQRKEALERELSAARSDRYVPPRPMGSSIVWEGFRGGPEAEVDEPCTALPVEKLAALLEVQTKLPDDFHPHPKIVRLLGGRREMSEGKRPLDWASAEAIAFASLATAGLRVRLTGQDSERGTFSQRHSVLHDHEDGHTYTPLKHLSREQAPIEISNSPLSEAGVLGFEYGYSLDWPDGLVAWEAQFGDFCNAAQVIVDQFITSAEEKWDRLSGLVLLLPHGLEGQGPEHSSARLERFVALCAEDNIQMAYPTTPAQYFHLLRRQVLSRWRKPLVVMTPKSLLRHPRCASSLEELAAGGFQRVLLDQAGAERQEPVERVLLCSGKIYYELARKREELGRWRVAILRLEQLYPFPGEALRAALARYSDGTPVSWVQEEPENQGLWRRLRAHLGERLFGRMPFNGVARPAAASPASGSASAFRLTQEELLSRAFGGV